MDRIVPAAAIAALALVSTPAAPPAAAHCPPNWGTVLVELGGEVPKCVGPS